MLYLTGLVDLVIPLRDVARIDKVHAQPAIAIIMKSSDHSIDTKSESVERLPIGNAVGSEFVFVEMYDREYVLDKFKHVLARVRSMGQAADQAADALANTLHIHPSTAGWTICDPLMTIFQASTNPILSVLPPTITETSKRWAVQDARFVSFLNHYFQPFWL